MLEGFVMIILCLLYCIVLKAVTFFDLASWVGKYVIVIVLDIFKHVLTSFSIATNLINVHRQSDTRKVL
ncbi:hypothetical protein V1527DRAFT_459684, partial [Lipomyces starkeyi]